MAGAIPDRKKKAMKPLKNRILVAIDFQEQSLNALEYSLELAQLFDANLVLLYVIEEVGVFGKLRSPEEYFKNAINEAREKFDELEKLAHNMSKGASVRVIALIEKGKPYDKIIDTAIDQEAIMIVLGKHSDNRSEKSRKIMGSNSLNVIREAPCPVITIKNASKKTCKFSKILLPLDFTRQTKKQVQKAIEFGGYFGAQINIISILRSDNKVTKLLKQVQLNQVKNAIQKNGIQCQTELIDNDDDLVADLIISHSKKIEADLIIIMTQQKKSFVNFYVGSTAQDVISNSDIPVLSIIPTAEFKPGMVTSMVDPLGLIQKKSEDDKS